MCISKLMSIQCVDVSGVAVTATIRTRLTGNVVATIIFIKEGYFLCCF